MAFDKQYCFHCVFVVYSRDISFVSYDGLSVTRVDTLVIDCEAATLKCRAFGTQHRIFNMLVKSGYL